MRRLVRLLPLLLLLLPPVSEAVGGEDWMFDPRFREGQPGDVLHAGPPPLLRSQLDGFVDLCEAAFDLAIPSGREQDLRDALELAYGEGTPVDREGFRALVAPIASLRSKARRGDDVGVQAGLSGFRRALDQELAAAPDRAANRIVREVLQLRQQSVWPGTPPVHGAAAAAWIELVEFLVALGRNAGVHPTEGQSAQLIRDTGAVLHGSPEGVRRRLRDAHRVWLRVKAQWDVADVDRRLALRWTAVRLVAAIMPPSRRIEPGPDGDLQAYARAAGALGEAEPAFDAWVNLAANPEAVLVAVDRWLGPLPDERDDTLLYR
ncbi:MAG: hypothetical protein ACYTG6_08940 [Planctomycetota bacterium]|jgi:hypothetical protein